MFKDELGLVKDVAAKIHVDDAAQPRFYKPRTVPYALRAKVDQELEQQGTCRRHRASAVLGLGRTNCSGPEA